jgi:hypothetical protein
MQNKMEPKALKYCSIDLIAPNHWAIELDKKFGIAIVCDKGFKLWIKINSTDRRGYRLIVQYVGKDAKETLNRRWTVEEMTLLNRVASILCQFYYDLNLIPQVYFAGDNAMQAVEDNVIIGQNEPSMLHVHILGRGLPEVEYIQGIPLDAVPVGEEFNLKGEGDQAKGLKKLKWSDEQLFMMKSKLVEFLSKSFSKEDISFQ